MTATLPPSLRQKLHPAWIHRLRWSWKSANDERLRGVLKPPVFAIDCGSAQRLGQWVRGARLLSISERHMLTAPWHDVEQTLLHEMAHQYVDEVLHIHDETAHGPAFVRACARLQVDSKASGPMGSAVHDETQRILDKVQKLFALAESQNVHEAEAAMAHANRLLLEYNLQARDTATDHRYGHRRIGKPAAALALEAKLVGGVLSEFFFVDCIWVNHYNPLLDRDERILEIMGDPTNLELAHYVHDYLHAAVVRHWQAAKVKLGRGDLSTRREFIGGMLTGFKQKLRDERKGQAERGLVWVGDPGLKHFAKARHPNIGSFSTTGWHSTDAHHAGQQAGRALQIHRGVTHQGPGGHLLGRS
ncbi:MAG: SprT-like domain-containing protein [Deltaproteobacteria bacterium]|nr:SprT-like domain-containing protein [Deltaproteobacteria bacterium]